MKTSSRTEAGVALRLLGPIRLIGSDRERTVVGGKARAVLAALGLRLNEVVPVELLVEELWDGAPPSTARNTVQVYVSTVRRGLEAVGGPLGLDRAAGGYRLTGRRDQVDWLLFEDLCGLARSADREMAATALRRALRLWEGPPLGNVVDTPLHRRFAPRMDDARLVAERLWAGETTTGTGSAPITPRGRGSEGFVGRRSEMAEVATVLADGGLVTLAGPPGVGKSRLAAEVAAQESEAVIVRLDAVTDPDGIVAAVADACGPMPPWLARRPPAEQVRSVVADARTLLVLDNCEHVAAACADLVRSLLDAGPVRVLATSTSPLGTAAETVYRLAPLPVPGPGVTTAEEALAADAVALFCARARAVRPEFELTDAMAPTIAEICRAVDGLPLSIELASGRISVLTPTELVERLSDQLRVLRALPKQSPERHASLASALTAAAERLSAAERELFAELARFTDSFTLRAAEAVSELPDVLDLLHGVVDASLVTSDVSGSEARFRMLEAVRQYGRTLPAPPDIAERLERYLTDLARDAAAGRHGPDRSRWQFRLDTARPDLHAVLRRAISDERFDLALPLVADLWWWWANVSPRAGLHWYRRVLPAAEAAGVEPGLLLPAQLAAAVIASYAVPSEALGYAERALESARALDDLPAMIRASEQLADIAHELGDLPRARRAGERAWLLAYGTGDRYAIGRCALLLAYNGLAADDPIEARRWANDALDEFAAAGDDSGVAECELVLAELLTGDGRFDEAAALLTRALSTFHDRRNDGQTARAAILSAIVSDRQGAEQRTTVLLGEAFDRHAEVGHAWALAHDLDLLAVARARRSATETAAAVDDLRWAALLVGAARAVRAEAGLAPLPHDLVVQQAVLDASRAALGGPGAEGARRRGESGNFAAAVGWGRTAL
ncbi:ATP-binding protein [Cryptosporangium japonicum]|uniref:OmpR/PhoB-type domain-containing protein n=1 Tax=Cryptosporangium japonicum TaxID=80872 RepID=A0ABN0TIF4_9ACTN